MKRLILIITALLALGLGGALPVAATGATGNSPADWTATYFSNCCLIDPPTVQVKVDRINFDWGGGSPAAGVPADNFSARFNASVFFPRGTYRFGMIADDLARLSINLEPIISTIEDGRVSEQRYVERFLDGVYNLQIDYQERTGNAFLKVDWELVSPTTAAPGGTTATVLVTTLNVRAEPSLNGAILTKVGAGQVFGVLNTLPDATWVQINANGVVGWVSRGLVRLSSPVVSAPAPTPAPQAPAPDGTVATTLANLRLRSAPAISNNTLTTIPSGSSARVLARDASTTWLKVDFNGQVGWVSLRFVSITPQIRLSDLPVATS
jgi:uncharacterized protein YraI